MTETIEQQRQRLYDAQRQAFSEYRLFLETTPLPQDGIPAASYLTQLEEFRSKLKRAETARKLFDDLYPLATHQYF